MVFVAVLDGTIPQGETYTVTLTTADDMATGMFCRDSQYHIFYYILKLLLSFV